MNIKINTICFILLLFLLIGVASATEMDNETLQQKITPDNDSLSPTCLDNQDRLKASDEGEKLGLENTTQYKLETTNNPSKLEKTVITNKAKVTIKAPDVKMYYKDGSEFHVTLKDDANKVMKKAKVKINIAGTTYTKTTDSKGKASINLNQNSGKYTVVTTFDETKNHHKKTVKSTVTIKSTINSKDLTKYYKNKAKYSATFYDKKGKLLKETQVKFKINSKTHSVKTNNKGIAKLDINLKPGTYQISIINPKTTETIKKTITIKTILETKDLTMDENSKTKFTVKILNTNGKKASNKKVTLKVNGKTYTPRSNSQGIASQILDLKAGKYTITTEYEGLIHTNQVTVNKVEVIKKTGFTHTTMIPTYVNITTPYVFHNSEYSIKQGTNGLIKMPKNDIYIVWINETQNYIFTQEEIEGFDTIVIGYKTHLVSLNGSGVKSDYNRDNLKGDGLLISLNGNYTQIEYRSTTTTNTELFAVLMDQGNTKSETISYIQNQQMKAAVEFYTCDFNEVGLRYNLWKYYSKTAYEAAYDSYDEITNHHPEVIKYANTETPVTFTNNGKRIIPNITQEDVITKFTINGKEELEKTETISYGLSKDYNPTLGFEVLQSYAIINEKITNEVMEYWININPLYMIRIGLSNVYGMFLSSLETAWLADKIADEYGKNLNVTWTRENTLTILGGINPDDTYLHILNADMGMNVTGEEENSKLFRVMNSIYLPNIESFALQPVNERYGENGTNSLDNILESIENNNFSLVQIGEIFYLLDEVHNSTIVINSTSGLAEVIMIDKGFAYKGSKTKTCHDCCSVKTAPQDVTASVINLLGKMKNGVVDLFNGILNKIHPLSILGYLAGNIGVGIAGKLGASGVSLSLASTVGLIMSIHGAGNYAKTNLMDEKDWHWAYKHLTFTRDGYLQDKKFFNIPKSDGTYDYVEVKINPDGSLNRSDVLYVGDGYSKKLTKDETYDYFTEEKWTSCNIPRKYQVHEVPLIFG